MLVVRPWRLERTAARERPFAMTTIDATELVEEEEEDA